jgi:hypothetical protein
MLNLPIVMFNYMLAFSLILFAQTAEISISTPKAGQVLRGQVQIAGNLDVPNFTSAELAFAYSASDAAQTFAWFAIQTFSQPVKDSAIAVWDTTLLTDGDYTLRLRVIFLDGTSRDILVSGLKIRNDVPLPTETPTATATLTLTPDILIPTLTPTRLAEVTTSIFPSPLPLPTNPASLTVPGLYSTFGRGALIAFVLFVLFSLLLRLRRN